MLPDADTCYRAVQARDPRFDGWFVTAVRSTGIYCRPSCPATAPLRRNVSFFPSSAGAQRAGYRACRRCRPDAAPGSPEWDARGDLAARAVRLIADGLVDRAGVEGLAGRLGYSTRQVNRALVAELGAGPLALARAQRAQTARVLLETTDLPITEVAFAAGFASVRQFNDTVRDVFAGTPGELRRLRRGSVGGRTAGVAGDRTATLTIRLAYREPLDLPALMDFLDAHAVAGLEEVRDGVFTRVLDLPHGPALASVSVGGLGWLACRLRLQDARDLVSAVARLRHLLDLDADPAAVDAALAAGYRGALAPLVARHPGLRSPGAVDGYETAVRAVVGQQVSVASARAVLGRIVGTHGEPAFPEEPWRLFPTPARLAEAEGLPLPVRRGATVRRVAAAVAGGLDLDAGADREATRAALLALPGIGPWTAEWILMRALGDPDVLPTRDLAVLRVLRGVGAPAGYADAETERGAGWAPWRSYATHHLWLSGGETR